MSPVHAECYEYIVTRGVSDADILQSGSQTSQFTMQPDGLHLPCSNT